MRSSVVRVLVVDHYRVVREGVRAMLDGQFGIEVVGQAGSIRDAAAIGGILRPDVVITGLELPDGRGSDLARDLRRTLPATRTIVFSPVADEELFFQAAVAGAVGFLIEDIEPEQLVAAIRTVGRGGSLITPETISELRAKAGAPVLPGAITRGLTGQECRIVAMVVEGATNGEIARKLELAEKTVRNYMSNILAKTGARNRTELTAAIVGASSRRRPGESRRVITLPTDVRAG